MRRLVWSAVFTALFFGVFTLWAGDASSADGKKPLLIVARSTSDSPKAIIEKYQPLVDYLAKKLNRPVDLRTAKSYGDILQQLKAGEIDGAILGSSAGARSVRDLGTIPVARPEKEGVSGYRGLIVVRKDGGIKKIGDLKGKAFDHVEKGASAGWIYPRASLIENKFDPDNFFSKVTFATKHDAAVMKVLNKEMDGASVKDSEYNKLSKSEPRVNAEMNILQKSTLFPDSTLLFRKDTPADTVKEVRGALLGIRKDGDGKAVLAAVGADRYIATEKKDFADLIKIMTIAKE